MSNDILYSPWRIDYILSEKENGCAFCFDTGNDSEHFVVYRSKLCFVILNHYPYNNGHIMVVPNKHTGNLSELNQGEIHDIFQTVQLAEKVLQKAYHPDGVNIGMNLGKAGGAGIADHLHVHLVPRWSGDTNFITTIGGTRVVPDKFENSSRRLKECFAEVLNDL